MDSTDIQPRGDLRRRPLRQPQTPSLFGHVGYPMRPSFPTEEVGIVADVQCGGWSTTLLNSLGVIYLLGNFNGYISAEAHDTGLKRLGFPPGYPPTNNSRYEPSTAIKQFSTGRNHVLGLSDDGKIWFWAQKQAVQVEFMLLSLKEKNVLRVVAGWDRSSVYVEGTGIIFWDPSPYDLRDGADVMLTHSSTVPGTGHSRKGGRWTSHDSLDSEVGVVTQHIVLEGYIVFTTELNKVFAYSTTTSAEVDSDARPVELTTFKSAGISSSFEIQDLQGSFRSFAIFTSSGEVLTASRSLIDAFINASIANTLPSDVHSRPNRIASLQHQSVISLAFGDYHTHALHANGTISSFGIDPGRVGAFGLGASHITSWLRGVQQADNRPDLVLSGEQRRTVWFEPLMRQWLHDSFRQIQDRIPRPFPSDWYVKSGDWFEEQGHRWEEGVSESEHELPAYFALKVAAAGWHSAALVLVDEEKAERARRKHIKQPEERHTVLAAPSNDLPAPRVGLATGPTWLWAWLCWLVRWFLGLTARDAAAAAAEADRTRYPASQRDDTGGVRYVWEDQELPHLGWQAAET